MNEMDKELERIRRKKFQEMFQNFRKGGGQMGIRIVIPVVDEAGLDARLSEHFGRAPYFAVIELDEKGHVTNQRTVPNVSEHFGGAGRSADNILQLKPNAVITYGMGPRGLNAFQSVRVAVLRANANTVREIVEAYNNDELEELTEGCHQARYR